MTYTPPEGFVYDPQSGRYYRQDGIVNGKQWVTWFDAASGEYEQVQYPAPVSHPVMETAQVQYPAPQPTPTKPPALLFALPVLTLLLGLGLAFYQAGGLQAMESEAIPSEITLFDLDDAPVITLQKSGDLGDISNVPLPDPTPAATPDLASDPSPTPSETLTTPTPTPTPTPEPDPAPKASDPVTVFHDRPATWVKVISFAEAQQQGGIFTFTIHHPEARAAFDGNYRDPNLSDAYQPTWYFAQDEVVTVVPGGADELTVTINAAATDYPTHCVYTRSSQEDVSFLVYITSQPSVLVSSNINQASSPYIFVNWLGVYDAEGRKQAIGAGGAPVSYQIDYFSEDYVTYERFTTGTATAYTAGFAIENNAELTELYDSLRPGGNAYMGIMFTVTIAGVDYEGYATANMVR
jgi:hypothetical protein